MFFIQKGADHSQQNINEIKSISHFTKMFCGFYFNGMQPFYFLTFQLNCTTGPFYDIQLHIHTKEKANDLANH